MKRTELNKLVFAYIIDCIDGEGYGKTLITDAEKLQFVWDTFVSKYCHKENLRYYGSVFKTFENWLMGLPSVFNVDYENHRIIEIAKSWGCIPNNATEKQEDKILGNWFNLITNKTFQLMKKHHVNTYLTK